MAEQEVRLPPNDPYGGNANNRHYNAKHDVRNEIWRKGHAWRRNWTGNSSFPITTCGKGNMESEEGESIIRRTG
jgi:hypothetical protein